MQPGILYIQVEDRSDMFHKFSLLKDHDVNYALPTEVIPNQKMYQGVREVDERDRIHRRRDDQTT